MKVPVCAVLVLTCCELAFAQEEKPPPDLISWSQTPGCFSPTLTKRFTITPKESLVEIDVIVSTEMKTTLRYAKPNTAESYQADKERVLKKILVERARALVCGYADGPDTYWLTLREEGKNRIEWSWQYKFANPEEEFQDADHVGLTRLGAERQTRAFVALIEKMCDEVVDAGRLTSIKRPIVSRP